MILTPKEQAIELVDLMYIPLPLTNQVLTRVKNISFEYNDWEVAKQCALIAVKMHLEELSKMKLIFSDRELHYKHWQEVKQEIINL